MSYKEQLQRILNTELQTETAPGCILFTCKQPVDMEALVADGKLEWQDANDPTCGLNPEERYVVVNLLTDGCSEEWFAVYDTDTLALELCLP